MFHKAFRIRNALVLHRSRHLSSKTRPDILACSDCTLFKFGNPTSEPSNALFLNLDWQIHDGSAVSEKPAAWAIIGTGATKLTDAALLGRARADPPSCRRRPFLGTGKSVEATIKKVAFNTRLESNSSLATSGEFTDFTARYFGIRKEDADATTLRVHLTKQTEQEDSVDRMQVQKKDFLNRTTKALKLDHLLDIPLIALSNGQTRRARIAKALLSMPEVLVLEEPFSALLF